LGRVQLGDKGLGVNEFVVPKGGIGFRRFGGRRFGGLDV
jgi:hypothetical protein